MKVIVNPMLGYTLLNAGYSEAESRRIVLNLQRFADDDVIVDDDSDVDVEIEGDDDDGTELPIITPKTSTMPSSVAPEAWKNVEEMLVTLSANTRVANQAVAEKMKEIKEEISELSRNVDSNINSLCSLMAEFKELLASATVEVPEKEVEENEQQKQDAKKPAGFLSRKKGRN